MIFPGHRPATKWPFWPCLALLTKTPREIEARDEMKPREAASAATPGALAAIFRHRHTTVVARYGIIAMKFEIVFHALSALFAQSSSSRLTMPLRFIYIHRCGRRSEHWDRAVAFAFS